ncbi:GNAT family N-acetyltransferase [Actinomyces howellii]|uniref:N-acyltransferase YncA n=1 Tax=Actinomyces howellii TaxID=52771 RepID=A0A3S4T8H3_9ACTO|nr:GNAT family N-acetyltransferase [Actinomyces howellii]VEG26138.1 N-acyltransferase YncA [Actinomyces howellii]
MTIEGTAQFTVRAATRADCPAVREIRNAAVRDSLAIWTCHEHSPQEAEAWLAPLLRRGTALVACDTRGAVVGFAVAGPWQSYEGYARTVEDSVYLSPAARGRGLGSGLLTALVAASRATGDRTMVAQIEAGNTASIGLHARTGFSEVGTIPAAGEKHGRVLDLVLMSLRL